MKYNPMSKEFQEKAKELGLTGYQYMRKLVKEEKLPNPTDIMRKEREITTKNAGFDSTKKYVDNLCQKRGFKDKVDLNKAMRNIWAQDAGYDNDAERQRERDWNSGKSSPKSENNDCSSWLGKWLGEELLFERFLRENIFEYVKWIGGERDSGIDFKCINPIQEFIDKHPNFKLKRGYEYKIQLRLKCLTYTRKSPFWNFPVNHGNIADYYMLCGLDNRDDLNLLILLMIHKDEMIRKGKGYKEEFWNRQSFTVTNDPYYIARSELNKFLLNDELNKLKIIQKEIKYGYDI